MAVLAVSGSTAAIADVSPADAGTMVRDGSIDAGIDTLPNAAASAPDMAAGIEPSAPESSASAGISIGSMIPIEIHAFASQGAILSTGSNFLVADSKSGSVEFNEVGINFSHQLTDRLRLGIQLFARKLGDLGSYTPSVDWFVIDYRFTDWLGVRAGRTKVPFGLYNEINDVDTARVPVLLPQSIYPVLNRDILLALTGAELYGYVRMGSAGGLEYRLYGGTIFVTPPEPPPPLQLVNFNVPYMMGGRLAWDVPIEGLRLAASVQALRFDTDYSIPGTGGAPAIPVSIGIPFILWLASAEYAAQDLLVAVEYGRWQANLESNVNPTTEVVNERYYGMVAYRVLPWFTPSVYYAGLFPDVSKRSGRENYRHDLAATLRFDINAYWSFKVEGHLMVGTAELEPSFNGGTAASMLPEYWGLFLAKTTVSF